MKKNKLFKTLGCLACGLGIATSISFITTSCGSSTSTPKPEPFDEVDLPYQDDEECVLNISELLGQQALWGFKPGFNIADYPNANTLVIPKRVTQIGQYAFCNPSSGYKSTIPDQITCIRYEKDFQYYNNEMHSDFFGINNTSIKTIDFGNTYIKLLSECFQGWSNLNTIKFDSSSERLPELWSGAIGTSIFKGISATGWIIAYGDGEKTAQNFKTALTTITKTSEGTSVFDKWTTYTILK